MNHSDGLSELATALVKAQSEFPTLVKKEVVRTGKYSYKYADLAYIINETQPVLSKNGLAVSQGMTEGGCLETLLIHVSGQWISTMAMMPVGPSSTPQEVGSLISYFRRYGYCAILGLVAEEDDDAASAQKRPPQEVAPAPRKSEAPPSGSPVGSGVAPVGDFVSLKRDLSGTKQGPEGRVERLAVSKRVIASQKDGKITEAQAIELRSIYAEKEK